MSTPEPILNKIKLLFNLANSPNPNEAENAKAMADKLISKYNITEEELKSLEEKKPLYGEEDKVFVTFGLVGWKQSLALAIAKQFYCQIVQEELVPIEGLHQFTYYVYGDKEDADNVKFVYQTFDKRIEDLIEKRCIGRGPVYISSYTEGLVEIIVNTIIWEGIDIPNIKVPSRMKPVTVDERTLNDGSSNLSVQKEEKEKPCKETVAPQAGTMIKDVQAYFKGLTDGKDFSLQEVLELAAEAQRLKELHEGTEAEERNQEEARGVSEAEKEVPEYPA
jgi:hypothetical protein